MVCVELINFCIQEPVHSKNSVIWNQKVRGDPKGASGRVSFAVSVTLRMEPTHAQLDQFVTECLSAVLDLITGAAIRKFSEEFQALQDSFLAA